MRLKPPLQSELDCPRPVCIQGMQERSAGYAVRPAARGKPGGIVRPRIATHHIIAAAPGIVGIVDAKLSVIEDIEELSADRDRWPPIA